MSAIITETFGASVEASIITRDQLVASLGSMTMMNEGEVSFNSFL